MSLSWALRWTLGAMALALPVSIAGTNIAAAAATALLAALALKGGEIPWRKALAPAVFALIFYCAVAAASSLAGVDRAASLDILRKDFHKLWVLGLLLVGLGIEPCPWAFAPMGAGFAFISALGIWQSIGGLLHGTQMRAHGFVHAVTYGELLALGVLGGVCFLRRSGRPAARRWTKAFLILCGTAFVLNQTRGPLIGLLAGAAVLFVLDRSLRPLAPWALAAALAVAGLWELTAPSRSIADLVRMHQQLSSSGRINAHVVRYALWESALEIFRDHPWLGAGPGNYRTVLPRYYQETLDRENVGGSAHNLYLHQLAERGLVGFLALGALLGVLTVASWRRARENPSPWNLWAASAVIAFLVMNLTEVAFQSEQLTTLMLFIWAWSEANRNRVLD